MSLDPISLLGQWSFRRVVDDRLALQRLEVEGTATFTRRDDRSIDWHERGVMHLPGGDVPVTTQRILVLEGSGSWMVDFADGRGFHRWAVGVELLHDCAPDLYRGRLESATVRGGGPADAAWTMQWAASGPAKDYVIDTRYEFTAC